MNSSVARYRRAVKKHLACGTAARKRLMDKLHTMLGAFLDENPTPTEDELHNAFGPPETVAAMLSEEITPEEKARYRRGKILLRSAAAVLLILIVMASAYIFFMKQIPLTTVDQILPNELPAPGSYTP